MKNFNLKNLLLMAGVMLAISGYAQPPVGYYNNAQGVYGVQLQQALHDIIDNHDALSYGQLWDAYHDSDPRADDNSLVWDMYSDNPSGAEPYLYELGDDQCGNYSGEGSCYNREHSWPKSWFNEGSPMKTDLVHVVPTDGYVNGKRSNHPYGEVDAPSWTSQNGSKTGHTNASWTSGVVFEPIDEYKGDFARIYFYMATRYYGEDGGWNSNDMVNGSQLKAGPLEMMMQWHENDPVSDKERNRNNAIYQWQSNRNPFVDHPEYVEYIWGDPNVFVKEVSMADVTVSPNPATDQVLFSAPKISNKGFAIYVYDNCGKQVKQVNELFSNQKIDVSDLNSGAYVVRIINLESGDFISRKLIMQ